MHNVFRMVFTPPLALRAARVVKKLHKYSCYRLLLCCLKKVRIYKNSTFIYTITLAQLFRNYLETSEPVFSIQKLVFAFQKKKKKTT